MAPLFGFDDPRPSFYDLSVGSRLRLYRAVFVFASVLLPLNRDGFRSDVVPLAGVEAVF